MNVQQELTLVMEWLTVTTRKVPSAARVGKVTLEMEYSIANLWVRMANKITFFIRDRNDVVRFYSVTKMEKYKGPFL